MCKGDRSKTNSADLPVYITPLSSTDMLMLLVPLVVRFKAESCLLSVTKNQKVQLHLYYFGIRSPL